MSERRTIGQILVDLGRITEDDVATALEHQRDEGGFFGEALVACGLVSQEELEWGLASQFDLPYVFPDADAVDLEAAALVSPEWALSHLVLPILKTEDTLRVVVDSPLKGEPVEELRARTELEVELALAAPATIRELIRRVYARASAVDEEKGSPLTLDVILNRVDDAEAARWGLSVRGTRAHAWWDERGTIRRSPVAGDWAGGLEQVLVPSPSQVVGEERRAQWDAEIDRPGETKPVEVRYIADESGREYLFRARSTHSPLEARFSAPSPGVVSEVNLLARSGTARFIVVADPPELGHEILPHLPALLLDPAWRSIYINAEDQEAAEEAFSLKVPADPETWPEEIDALRAFHFDVVTVDLSGGDAEWAASALDIASVAFLLWKNETTEPAYEAGVRWRLDITRLDDGGVSWSLEPLRSET